MDMLEMASMARSLIFDTGSSKIFWSLALFSGEAGSMYEENIFSTLASVELTSKPFS